MYRSRLIGFILALGLLLLFCLFFRVKTRHEIRTHRNLKESINLIRKNIQRHNTDNPKQCNLPYPVLYINLDKDTDRRDFMEQQLSKLSSKYYRIPGINGKKIKNLRGDSISGGIRFAHSSEPPSYFQKPLYVPDYILGGTGELGAPEISFVNDYPELQPGELGCTLSHILAIFTAYKLQLPIALICEDDCSFDTCGITTSILDVVNNAPDDWEVLQLFTGGLKKDQITPETSYLLFELRSTTWSNAAYLINRKGMEKVISRLGFPLHLGPDSEGIPDYGVADRFIPLIATTYCVVPPILGINTKLESTIHNEHIDPIHVPALYTFLQGVNSRLLQSSPWKIHVVKSWDQNWVRSVLPFPLTEKIEQANLIVTNANADPTLHLNRSAFTILIDREPIDISHWKVDLVISTKRKDSLRLPENTPSIYLPCYSPSFAEGKHSPQDLLSPKKQFPKTNFCAFAYSNCNTKFPGVSTRLEFLKLLQKRSGNRVDSWGKCAPTMKLPKDKGTWDNATLYQPYKFVIAFENDYPSGYISEKLTLPMLAGAIPIYFGSEEVGNHFNTKSFINVRDFGPDSWDSVIDKILELDRDEKSYQSMLSEPWLVENRLTEHFSWWDGDLGNFQKQILSFLPNI